MPRAGLISAVLCVATGLLFALVDIREAFARKTIVERSVAWIRQQDPGARIWGAGGIVYHAQRAGMQIDWDTTWGRPCRACRPGDWIVVDGLVTPTDRSLIWSTRLTEEDRLPLTTFPVFYFGGSPMLHLSGPRATTDIYRLPQP